MRCGAAIDVYVGGFHVSENRIAEHRRRASRVCWRWVTMWLLAGWVTNTKVLQLQLHLWH